MFISLPFAAGMIFRGNENNDKAGQPNQLVVGPKVR